MTQTTIDGKNPAFEMWCNGYGPIPASYMFVGISAGRLGAIKTQVPFTKGPSGRLLQRCLGRLGFSQSDEFSIKPKLVDCYLTNLVKGVCLTEDGLNRLPTKDEFEFWWPTLRGEFNQVKPKVVVALSDAVYTHILDHLKDTPLKFGSVCKIKHPRWYESHGALANEDNFEIMVKDYSKAILGKELR